MRQRDKNYFVKIKPELLFDFNKKFKSFYAPWVYVYLKLDYNNSIQNASNSYYNIDKKSICEFFSFDPATLSRALTQLEENKLLESRRREYRLLNDLNNSIFSQTEEFPDFIQIYNNFFIDFKRLLYREFEELRKQPRSLFKAIQVFYYLITKNRHILLDLEKLDSNENVKTINKNLKHDENYIKEYLNILEIIGYIEYDDNGKIFTKYNLGTSEPFKKSYTAIRNSKLNNTIIQNSEFEFEAEEEFNQFQENADIIIEPEPIQETECSSEVEKNIIENEDNKINPEPATDKEKIDRILNITDGDRDKTRELLEAFNISEASIREYLENITEDQISESDITEEDDLQYPYSEPEYKYIVENKDQKKLFQDFKKLDEIGRYCKDVDLIEKQLQFYNFSPKTIDAFLWLLDNYDKIIKEEDLIPV